jgi:oligoendopeptidase F
MAIMTKKTLPTWNLDDILPLKDFNNLYDSLKDRILEFDKHFAKMQPGMTLEDFTAYMEFSRKFHEDMSLLGSRPHLMESIDTKDSEARAFTARAKDLGLEVTDVTQKIGQWLKGKEVDGKETLDEANAVRLFASLGDLEYRYNFMRKNAKHTLSESEEKIINAKDSNGIDTLLDLRELIEAEQRYEAVIEEGKKPVKFDTQSELMTHVRSPSSLARENVYRALFREFDKNIDKYHLVYQSIVKDWVQETKIRDYESPIAMRNLANHVPDKAIDVLMDVCVKNRIIFQDYFRTKARLLGVDKLRRFDLYAPIDTVEAKYTYAEAEELILEVYHGFSPQFAANAKKVIDAQHIHAALSPNKRGGAFATTITPSITPYVFMSYAGTARDVSTLAHELGHAVHFLYASDKPYGAQFANLPLSETASTFGEMLLFEHLLEKTTNPQERRAMLVDKLADSYATIMRQNYFVKFEKEIHERISEGLKPDDLSAIWLAGLQEQFGDAVEVDPIFAKEWSYIPHIVNSPFYCYAYSFGDLLSLALYARYKAEGQSFVPKIEAILAAGGSKDPQEVLNSVGIDMADANFWQGSFEIIKAWQQELEQTS